MDIFKKKNITITAKEANIIANTGSFANSDKLYYEFRKTIWDKIKFSSYNKEFHIIKEIPIGLEDEHIKSLTSELSTNGFLNKIIELDNSKQIKIILIQW